MSTLKYTDKEKKEILKAYTSFKPLDLNGLAKKLNRPKTNISRYARELGLTNRNRDSISKVWTKKKLKYLLDHYKTDTLKEISEKIEISCSSTGIKLRSLGFYKPHVSNSRQELKARKKIRSRKTKITNGTLNPAPHGKNNYSRCHGGRRKDLNNIYFRSSWEANVARYFNYVGEQWEFEPRQFVFDKIRRGSVSYTPDFYLPNKDQWVEVKGWMDAKSKTKLKRFKKYYPGEASKLIIIGEREYKRIKNYSKLIPGWEH